MSKHILQILATALILASCQSGPAVNEADFNGRWNITVPDESRGRAWWLQVEGAGGELKGLFVGAPGGGMYECPEMSIQEGELRFVFERRYRQRGETYETAPNRRGVYRARLVEGRLQGTFEVEGFPETKLEWFGERAPVIADKDDGTWKEDEPVELFNGADTSTWTPMVAGRELGWGVEDGILTNNPPANNLVSMSKFWNFKLHAEYRLFERSNSGIGLRGRYEIQIADDYGRVPSKQGHAAVYYRIVPSVNASKPPGEWQTMDVTLIGRDVTVVLNGTTVIDKAEIEGLTAVANDPAEDQPGPITIQGDHRKIDIRKLVVTPLVK